MSNVTITGTKGTSITPSSAVAATDSDTFDTGTPYALVYVEPGTTNFNLTKIAVNGSNAFGALACGGDFLGIDYDSSSGALSKVNVSNVTGGPSCFGDQPGAYGDILVVTNNSTPTGSATVSMNKVSATLYDKEGITCEGKTTTCTIAKSTVTGDGTISTQAQNGIGVYDGATATITTSSVTGDSYNAQPASPGCQIDNACYSASGILGYGAASLTVNNNKADTGSDINIVDVASAHVNIENNKHVSGATEAGDLAADGIVAEGEPPGAVSISGNTVSGDTGGGIQLYGTHGAQVTGNSVSTNSPGDGIDDIGGTSDTLLNNTSSANASGISLQGTTTDSVTTNNTGSNSSAGIALEKDTGSTLNTNTVDGNTTAGILAAVSQGAILTSNTVETNGASAEAPGGVLLEGSDGLTIENNTIEKNVGVGITLNGSSGNHIKANQVENNALGFVATGAAFLNEVCGQLPAGAFGTTTKGSTTLTSPNAASAPWRMAGAWLTVPPWFVRRWCRQQRR